MSSRLRMMTKWDNFMFWGERWGGINQENNYSQCTPNTSCFLGGGGSSSSLVPTPDSLICLFISVLCQWNSSCAIIITFGAVKYELDSKNSKYNDTHQRGRQAHTASLEA
mmetsp:Transcript_34238/g.53950  ORF Transcript_34238/g.53950 Transcript_34238/m.53950 type:complete len:110 (-) Transcript_34238:351-680(-)